MSERCWFRKFYGDQCENVGRWRFDPSQLVAPSLIPFLAQSIWCDEHRHDNDVEIDARSPSGDRGSASGIASTKSKDATDLAADESGNSGNANPAGVSHTMPTIYTALARTFDAAWGRRTQLDMPFASIPARPGVDADLILSDAIDELAQLRVSFGKALEEVAYHFRRADALEYAIGSYRQQNKVQEADIISFEIQLKGLKADTERLEALIEMASERNAYWGIDLYEDGGLWTCTYYGDDRNSYMSNGPTAREAMDVAIAKWRKGK